MKRNLVNDSLEENELNDELEVGTSSTCLICGQNLDLIEDLIIDTSLEDGSKKYAHIRCTEALSNLLGQIGYRNNKTEHMKSIVRNIDGKMVITQRDFPNQYIPILLFYSLHDETPTPINKLKEWLDLNDLDFSNPIVPVGRLVKKGELAVMVEDDRVSRYFLTDTGATKLNEYLGKMSKEE